MNYQVSAVIVVARRRLARVPCAGLAIIPMSQIKIFGLRSSLSPIMREISDVIHSCAVDALHYPVDKRAHRFFPLETGEFFNPPPGETERYTIIEITGCHCPGYLMMA
jgi:hypothetical protein